MKKICVIGLGYIGLPTASILATSGFEVTGIDTNSSIIKNSRKGMTHIKEAGLQDMLEAAVKSGNLKSQSETVEADAFIICVPTPYNRRGEADLSYVESAAKSIVPKLQRGNLVVLESTIPPGTTTNILRPILEESGLIAGEDFYVVYCPERILPGNLIDELIHNNRVIGGINRESAVLAKEIYERFVKGDIYLTDALTVEFVKLLENTFGAVNIALANEFALIAEKIGVNVFDAIYLANKHPRVRIFTPGPGVGGHCIPIDPWFLVEKAPELTKLIPLAMRVNQKMPDHVVSLVKDAFLEARKRVEGAEIAILGVAYKGDVNDSRESPAIPIIKGLIQLGANIKIYDPLVTSFPFQIGNDLEVTLSHADALVIITDHSEFKELNLNRIKDLMNKQPILIDCRNVVSDATGFIFRGIGVGR